MASAILITGPPASGKSRLALERFLAHPDAVLLTPTATMAEHLRNELARAGARVRPSRVTTLARFLDSRTRLMAADESAIHFAIQDALDRLRPPTLAGVAEFPGFRRALAALIEEAPQAVPPGASSADYLEDLKRVFDDVQATLTARGMALRETRLAAAQADPAGLPGLIVLDGFFRLSRSEISFLEWLARNSEVAVTLPQPSAQREALLAAGFAEHSLTTVRRRPRVEAFHAPTIDREIDEIVRRILDQAAQGRPFREMGIILRSKDPYGPALETALERFRIPARFYFAKPLIEHPAAAFLASILRSMLRGWDHESLLSALRMPISGVGATRDGDRFDLEARERLPGAGLDHSGIPATLRESLARLESWRRDRLPPQEWAVRFRLLRELLPEPIMDESLSRERLENLRSTAAALDLIDAAVDHAAASLPAAAEIRCAEFWERCETALALEPLRAADRRRDVVHVIDVYEARQWELPLVFVCGLVERHFPQYHREDSLLNDAARRRAGLETSGDRQREENFLFELAITRATVETVLSYAEFDDKGDPQIPSFFLQGIDFKSCETRIRPRPRRDCSLPLRSSIDDAELRDRLAEKHGRLAPTSIESFLQCPFQFFAGKTLRLRPRPAAPRDRLDNLLQGSILHRALAERTRLPLLGSAVFDEIFRDECRRAHVPDTYRTEAVRLELLRNFEAFWEDGSVALGWPSRVEQEFLFAVNPLLSIRGRIDRIDVGPSQQALVIDYKYSAAAKIRDRVEDSEGSGVQGGLYLAAAQKHFGLEPAGMLFCGLRKDVAWGGWHVPIPGLERVGEVSSPARLRELMDDALGKAEDTFTAITSGRIAPRPADESKCRWCDFRDVCRIDTAAEETRAATS